MLRCLALLRLLWLLLLQIPMGGVLPLLRSKFAQKQDIFYINYGVW
jgi:hypothetical protein